MLKENHFDSRVNIRLEDLIREVSDSNSETDRGNYELMVSIREVNTGEDRVYEVTEGQVKERCITSEGEPGTYRKVDGEIQCIAT